MIFYLNHTNYQQFDAWLCNKAGKYDFRVSYDEVGLIDDYGDITNVPKSIYPLRIFLSKIHDNGLSFNNDVIFISEEVGERLKICPKFFSEHGKENSIPILEEIGEDWPETLPILQIILNKVDKENKCGRPHYTDDLWAHNEFYINHRPKEEVKKNWLAKIMLDPVRCNLEDTDRQFREIMKEDFGN